MNCFDPASNAKVNATLNTEWLSFFSKEVLDTCNDGSLDYVEFSRMKTGTLFFWQDGELEAERFVKVTRTSAVNLDTKNDIKFKAREMCMYWGHQANIEYQVGTSTN